MLNRSTPVLKSPPRFCKGHPAGRPSAEHGQGDGGNWIFHLATQLAMVDNNLRMLGDSGKTSVSAKRLDLVKRNSLACHRLCYGPCCITALKHKDNEELLGSPLLP